MSERRPGTHRNRTADKLTRRCRWNVSGGGYSPNDLSAATFFPNANSPPAPKFSMSSQEDLTTNPVDALQSEKGQFPTICCELWMDSPRHTQSTRSLRDADQKAISRAPGSRSWRAGFRSIPHPRRVAAGTSGTISGLPGGSVSLGGSTTTRNHRKATLKR